MAEIPELVITNMEFPPYSVRGVRQSLEPIPAATQLRRTVNGALADVSDPLFQKYRSVISCTDQQPPVFAFPGVSCVVDCVGELAAPTAGFPGNAERPIVTGSARVDGEFTLYRPVLTMRIVGFSFEKDEWGAIVSWTLTLEEV